MKKDIALDEFASVSLTQLRSAFNYNRDLVSQATGLQCLDESKAQQSAAEETDINTIVNRFLRTGEMPRDLRAPTYGDFDEVFDFQTAMNAVRQANESFMSMPAQLRARFHNSPQEFLEFTNNAENYDEAVKLGIVVPRTQEATPTPPATPEVPTPPVKTNVDEKSK